MTESSLARSPAPVLPPPGDLQALRQYVRDFVAGELLVDGFTPQLDCWMGGFDRAFSRRAAGAGLVGMTIPIEYGGRGRTFLERFVVTEELLAAGAPVAAHWFADRQIAPSLLRHGNEEQRRRILPGIAAGTTIISIGMSEPESGSDLASVRTRGRRVEGGWLINGRKVWTSHAHRADLALVLVRTTAGSERHQGLSQLLVDLAAPGIQIDPIISMNGAHDFNEVLFEDVFVPDRDVVGTVGEGWRQVVSELGFERSGPERFLSVQPVLEEAVAMTRLGQLTCPPELGRDLARMIALHHASTSVAEALTAGTAADELSTAVKLAGSSLEGDILEHIAAVVDGSDPALSRLCALLDAGLLARAGFTLRGGTHEILRGIQARALGLR